MNGKKLINNLLLLFLVSLSVSCATVNSNGVLRGSVTDHEGKPLQEVAVSDGAQITLTDSGGHFELRRRGNSRFIFISVPSGYRSESFYQKIDGNTASYDFMLFPHKASEDSQSPFLHLTDTETAEGGAWLEEIQRYIYHNKTAFIIHTGDICYEDGMRFHEASLSFETMGVPVYYSIGNHDLVEGEYGEQLYEDLFGPVYYSFNSGGIHYVVTPMLYGDYKPSYTKKQIARWLRKDLETLPEGTPVVLFNHDLNSLGDDFEYKGIDLGSYNLKGWGFGHWHINYLRKSETQGITSWTVTPPKGGIDHSPGVMALARVDESVKLEIRYPYWEKRMVLPVPGIAVVYDSALDVESVVYTPGDGSPSRPLLQKGLFTWGLSTDDLPWEGSVTAVFSDGSRRTLETADFTSASGLSHMANLGSRVFMTSLLSEGGRLYAASVDDSGEGAHFIYGVDEQSGQILWKYKTLQSVRNDLVYYEGLVAGADGDGNIYILNGDDGTLRHMIPSEMSELGQNMTGTARSGSTLYGGFSESLKAVDMISGEVIWRNSDWRGGEGTVSSLVLQDGLLLAGANWRALYAHDAQTGDLLWENREVRFQSSTPVFTKEGILNINGNSITILDADEGKILFTQQTPYEFKTGGTPLRRGDILYLPTSRDGLVAWDLVQGAEIWNTPVGEALIYTAPYSWPSEQPVSTVETSPVLVGDILYFGGSDGFIYALDPLSGQILSKIDLGIPVLADLTVHEDHIHAVDFDGNIWSLSL